MSNSYRKDKHLQSIIYITLHAVYIYNMVQGIDILKVDVFHQKFNSSRPRFDPLCKLDLTHVYSAGELRREYNSKCRNRRNVISGTVLNQCKWYFDVMLRLLETVGDEYGRLRINNWLIDSSCERFFTIEQSMYDFIISIVTPHTVFWFATKISEPDASIYGTQMKMKTQFPIKTQPPYYHSMFKCSVYETPCRELGRCTGNVTQKKFLSQLFKGRHAPNELKRLADTGDDDDGIPKEGDIVLHTYPINGDVDDDAKTRQMDEPTVARCRSGRNFNERNVNVIENVEPRRMARLTAEFYQILLRRRLAEEHAEQSGEAVDEDDDRQVHETLLQEFIQNLY